MDHGIEDLKLNTFRPNEAFFKMIEAAKKSVNAAVKRTGDD